MSKNLAYNVCENGYDINDYFIINIENTCIIVGKIWENCKVYAEAVYLNKAAINFLQPKMMNIIIRYITLGIRTGIKIYNDNRFRISFANNFNIIKKLKEIKNVDYSYYYYDYKMSTVERSNSNKNSKLAESNIFKKYILPIERDKLLRIIKEK